MSKKTEAVNRARANAVALNFFRVHPEISNCDANAQMIESTLDAMLLDATNPESYEIAYLKIGNQLAKAEKPVPIQAEPTPPEEEPEVVEEVPTREWSKDRLRSYLKKHTATKPPAEKWSLKIRDESRLERDSRLADLMAHLTGAQR